ncbi:MAG: asparagine synthase [Candidatus Scalindua rubra]|uniref:asparagine synthase (glutamine-hydrolyzing) n=1 Tax=Candidatus Scalindua rubra TaxID=1872076 RepID=A0A1E3X6N9_9BACT|nr:MAG: asparagine synthase [Candidatus Scalindua rubra]
MCGIVGIVNLKLEPVNPFLLKRMTQTTAHRGPDSDGHLLSSFHKNTPTVEFNDPSELSSRENGLLCHYTLGLGVRRLNIIDLSKAGNQPLSNENRSVWIAYNGEFYNYKDYSKDLKDLGHIFKSRTDTEVVIHLYEEYGIEDTIKRMNGMFAFALYDTNIKKLYLVRDRFGIKPLYYYYNNDLFVFSSEIKALLQHPEIRAEVDEQSLLQNFKLRYVASPKSIFRNILKLSPGHYLTLTCNKDLKTHQYWNIFERINTDQNHGEDYYIEKYKDLLTKSVKRRLISDVPFGAYLSGGIDSSTIVSLMSRLISIPVKTFNVSFGVGGPYDEDVYAKQVADFLKTEHHKLTIAEDSFKLIKSIIYHLDEPIVDPAVVPTFLLSKYARNYVTVVLTGEGSDEINFGYSKHCIEHELKLFNIYCAFPNWFKKTLHCQPFKRYLFERFESIIQNRNNLFKTGLFNNNNLKKLLHFDVSLEDLNRCDIYEKYEKHIKTFDQRMILPLLGIHSWMLDDLLVKVDKMTMAFSLEARVPYLDHELAEFALSIPPELKLKGNKTKCLLRKVSGPLLPKNILRRRQHGFNVPDWLKKGLKEITYDLLSESQIQKRGYLRHKQVQCMLQDHFSGRKDWFLQIWGLLVFEVWCQTFLDQNYSRIC